MSAAAFVVSDESGRANIKLRPSKSNRAHHFVHLWLNNALFLLKSEQQRQQHATQRNNTAERFCTSEHDDSNYMDDEITFFSSPLLYYITLYVLFEKKIFFCYPSLIDCSTSTLWQPIELIIEHEISADSTEHWMNVRVAHLIGRLVNNYSRSLNLSLFYNAALLI